MIREACGGLLVMLLAGCAVESTHDRSYVATGIETRTGRQLGPAGRPGEINLPPGVSLADGLSQEDAVAVALWNNAQFQADLVALGFARSDLTEAKLLPNPVFSFLLPVGPSCSKPS